MPGERLLLWGYRRFRPRAGWTALLLLLAIVGLFAGSVVAADWVPEIDVVYRAAPAGLLLAAVLAHRPLRARWAWALLVAYGAVLVVIWLSRTISLSLILLGPEAAGDIIRRDLLLLGARVSSWLEAISAGRRTTETVFFALGVGWLSWLLTAYAAWAVFRTRRPVQALTVLGVALAVNNYFAGLSIAYGVAFIGLAILLLSLLHFANLQELWDRRGVDYSNELRIELATASAVVAALLMTVALVVPAIPYGEIARAFARSEAVSEAEAGLEQSLAGVRPPAAGQDDASDLAGGQPSGVLPRSFLIGNPPELAETEVMRARVAGPVPAGLHWRGVTVDTYSRTGWRIAAGTTVVTMPAGAPLGLDASGPRANVDQTIRWTGPTVPSTRYVLGVPLSFDVDVDVTTRDGGDLVRVSGQGPAYGARSAAPRPAPDQLRAATMDDVPESVLALYTALPDTVPRRVHTLAADVAGDRATPYDRAVALEQFLRQYRYSLEDSRLPPPGQDPVDFFLFDLRVGYCDYYASSMVVMARSLGLPARFTTGYLQQPVNEAGEQVILQLHAHSWAEIYFPGYGWIEFEPTAGFATGAGAAGNDLRAEPAGEVPPPPETRSLLRRAAPGLLLLALFGGIVALAAWRQRPWHEAARRMPVLWAYGRLQEAAIRLGRPPRASETPAEFGRAFREQVDALSRTKDGRRRRGWEERIGQVTGGVEAIVGTYARRQYGPPAAEEPAQMRRHLRRQWRRVRGPLWRLWLRWKLRR